MKGGEKLQLGLINSWRKMELTSVQGIPTDKIDGQFTQIINALKTKPQSGEFDQKSAQNEGLNQLLTILSNATDVKYQTNVDSEMETDSIDFTTEDDEFSLNLEALVSKYHPFSDGVDIPALDDTNMDSVVAETFANLENKITQVLKSEMNTKLAPDMFKQTELPALLKDLKRLEQTVNKLPEMSAAQNITGTVQDLHHLILSISNVIALNANSATKNADKNIDTKAGNSFTNNSTFVGALKFPSAKNTVEMADKEQMLEGKQQNAEDILVSEDKAIPFEVTNQEQLPGQIVEASLQERVKTAPINKEFKSEMNAPPVLHSKINNQVVTEIADHLADENPPLQMDKQQKASESIQQEIRLTTDNHPIETNAVEMVAHMEERSSNTDTKAPVVSEIGMAFNGIDEDYLLQMTREQKNNLLSQQNSSSEPVLEETEVVMKEAVIQGSEDNGDIPKRYSTIDTKLLAIQNRVLQESRNIVGKETNTTNSKMDASQTIVTEATSELKAIISSILTKLDKQLEQKNTPVVQKVINPIMVSSLRKAGESLMPSVEIKATTVKGNENDIDSNVLPTVQNTFIKQYPFTLLTSSGEMAQPKNVEEQFAKLLANSTFTKVGDIQKLSIRLAPDHLGSIRIEITQNEGNMIARIITTTAEAKETLEKQLTSLKHGFAAQNLQVDKLDIVVSSQPQEKLQKEQQQQQEQQQSQSQRHKKDADEDENKRKTSFFEELLNMEV
ncbi:Flagellar hook-length control protein FliK [Mycobacteroides abscessus subsp. abscessus]|nr:Flagellar hook-length control protein FliK [Mycobacteroides abscessus subsp. abscessus]